MAKMAKKAAPITVPIKASASETAPASAPLIEVETIAPSSTVSRDPRAKSARGEAPVAKTAPATATAVTRELTARRTSSARIKSVEVG